MLIKGGLNCYFFTYYLFLLSTFVRETYYIGITTSYHIPFSKSSKRVYFRRTRSLHKKLPPIIYYFFVINLSLPPTSLLLALFLSLCPSESESLPQSSTCLHLYIHVEEVSSINNYR